MARHKQVKAIWRREMLRKKSTAQSLKDFVRWGSLHLPKAECKLAEMWGASKSPPIRQQIPF